LFGLIFKLFNGQVPGKLSYMRVTASSGGACFSGFFGRLFASGSVIFHAQKNAPNQSGRQMCSVAVSFPWALGRSNWLFAGSLRRGGDAFPDGFFRKTGDQAMSKRIYISGASGAGVSTLGVALADSLRVPHFDVDDCYWYPTDPPYEKSRPPEERIVLLKQSLADLPWVLSGSLDGWGAEVIENADLVVFIDTPTPLRMERLRSRESQRYSQRILLGGDMYANHQKFLAWAESYEAGNRAGRSRPRHELWLKQLTKPTLRLNGEISAAEMVVNVVAAISELTHQKSRSD
jgi:adenylate kinase family enzyme